MWYGRFVDELIVLILMLFLITHNACILQLGYSSFRELYIHMSLRTK
jgi:hypothetical protein